MKWFCFVQEALEDREKQIQSLLADREFEQAEVASATNQVAKVHCIIMWGDVRCLYFLAGLIMLYCIAHVIFTSSIMIIF